MRQTLIAGNWKMNGTLSQAEKYLETLLPQISSLNKNILLAVPFTLLSTMSQRVKGSSLKIGAQNMSDQDMGAFTGEISCSMIQDAGARFVILGHSERRHLQQETDELIHKKLMKAISLHMQPILCVGETLQEKESGEAEKVLHKQLQGALEGLSSEEASRVVLAYEPVWAIGTGVNATPELADAMHKFCRNVLCELFSKEIAELVPILYGGSVKPDNITSFLQKEHIDGALIGGASLDPLSFLRIIQSS